MSKTGRNEPCPCGSGKKYKKCCLAKEQRRSVSSTSTSTSRRKDSTDHFFEDLPDEPAGPPDENDASEIGTQSRLEFQDEPFVSRTISDEVPEIGEQESAFVNAWWKAYRGMKDPDEIIRHLDGFFQAHPALVTNLEPHEVLFDLRDRLVKAGRASDYIELLQRVRRDFPDAYLRGFGYYDRDIICYKIASQDREGIEDYLNWFEEYPDNDADILFNLIDFLMATECDEPLIGLLEAAYYPICRSHKVIGGDEIMGPLILSYCAPYLDRGWTLAELDALSGQLKTIRIPLQDHLYRPEYLDSLFKEISGDLDAAFFATFYERRDIHEYYRVVTDNFMGWLRRKKKFSWMKAQFYRNQVNNYLVYVIPDGKRPKRPFVFSRTLLETTIIRMARQILSLDSTRTLGALNASYWFAEYLRDSQVISEGECADVQEWCEDLWRSAIFLFLESTIEARAFDTFPQ